MPVSLTSLLDFAARLWGPLTDWGSRLLSAAKTVAERFVTLCERINTRGGLMRDRLAAGSHQVAAELAREEEILAVRLERLFPAISRLLAAAVHPINWVRASKARGLAVAGILFALSVGIPLVSIGMRFYDSHTAVADNRILLYSFGAKRLKAYPPGTLPGTQDTASLMLYTRLGGIQPQAGMTLEQIRQAGLVVGWMYRLDPGDWEGEYASPDQPDEWISSKAPNFQAWMKRRREAVQAGADGEPLVPCDVHVRDHRAGGR